MLPFGWLVRMLGSCQSRNSAALFVRDMIDLRRHPLEFFSGTSDGWKKIYYLGFAAIENWGHCFNVESQKENEGESLVLLMLHAMTCLPLCELLQLYTFCCINL